ncbi:TetR/AcrR family transcriptional regulator [Cellulomonas alba]|uniref:Helix-turn-helix domain-containing protein n=1 Tax=Cellulomonas alba TaxID=3053467 RepID=A0ABT7SJT6_9CELL|nr:TetR/AcrR family transcriptional regulator [Cellulomonas alba]MDM7856450.1 helix-turn-helix domain-containing protein [Cellulomonas alba]
MSETTGDERPGAGRSGRAAPLPPDERRAAILRHVRPLLLERGVSVTTRELAEAAGVAEGTLFRVFADKLTLIGEAAFAAVDPAGAIPLIDAIDRRLPLRERLVALLEIGFTRVGDTMRWMAVLHELGKVDPRPAAERDTAAKEGWARWTRRQTESEGAVRAAAARVFEGDDEALTVPAAQAAELLNVVLVGASVRLVDARRRGVEPVPIETGTLVDLFLHGVLADRGEASPSGAPPPVATAPAPTSPEPERVA